LEGILLAVAAVIVTYNSANVINSCLEALAKMAPQVMPVIVDNSPGNQTLRHIDGHFPVHCTIANPENRGFAAAVNQGVQASHAEFVLLLNPDVELLGPVDTLIEESRKHGVAAGKLVDSEGRTQAGFTIRRFPTPATLIFELLGINRLLPNNPINRRYRYMDRDLECPGPVEQPAGAFLMFRRDVWLSLGGFDEGFKPVWFEDVDFCRRAALAGYGIEYVPSVMARHQSAHSIAGLTSGCRARYWCASLLRYAAKHFHFLSYRGICAAMVLGSVPRMVAGMIRERNVRPVIDFSKIIQFAGLCLVSSRRRGGE
jgi:N-acetylglucosaminyl-diphospho-decaprenol L-rhamnosyltransferase